MSGILLVLVFLGAAVLAVPAFRYLGLSAVLGYLVAGLVIGPAGIGLFRDPDAIRSVAELGIVMFLFVIGLELKPSKLVSMRRDILGLGVAQLLVTMLVLGGVSLFAGLSPGATVLVAFAFALSATAIALQILNERGALASTYGQKSFAVLLFQDLAIVPFIAVIPLLAVGTSGKAAGTSSWPTELGIALAALGALLLAGRFLLNPLFRLLARADAREVMTAAALLVVLGSAEAMHAAGLSAALGAFVAGLLLSESQFRHQLEADIEPFRGLLLGLFFMSVGMGIELSVVLAHLGLVLGAGFALVALKFALNYGLLRAVRQSRSDSARAAVLLATTGEFAFVILPLGVSAGLIAQPSASILSSVAALTMFLGPLAAKALEALLRRRRSRQSEDVAEETFEGAGGQVLVIGFGRFGQVVNQLFLAADRDVTVIDRNIDQIRTAERFGFKVYFGDGRRLDVLRAAGAEHAALIAICVDDREAASMIAEMVQRAFPAARVFARAYDRTHALDLMARGIRNPYRETFEAALAFGRDALVAIGTPEIDADQIRSDTKRRDQQRLLQQRDGGLYAGLDLLHGVKLKPEPLSVPRRSGADLSRKPADLPKAVDQDGSTGASG